MVNEDATSVKIADLADMATHSWRLNTWLQKRENDETVTAVRYVSRKLAAFLESQGITVVDLTNHTFDAGIAAEVIDTVISGTGSTRIIETVSPLVCWNGKVVKHAEVIIQKAQSESIDGVKNVD